MKDFVVEGEVKIPLDYKASTPGLVRLAGDQGKPKGYQCEVDQIKPAAIYGIGLGGWIYLINKPQMSMCKEFRVIRSQLMESLSGSLPRSVQRLF